MAKPYPDIINALFKEYSDSLIARMLVESMTHTDAATHNGDKYNQANEFIVSIANPLYILYEVPADAPADVELVKRFFQADNDGADLAILWDYDVSTATKTTIASFNANNKFRGIKGPSFEISLLNPNTFDANTGIYTITGAATIVDDGIVREPGSIPSTGVGSNKSGGISPDVGSRIYKPGTGYLFRVTSLGDSNKITAGYTWTEDSD